MEDEVLPNAVEQTDLLRRRQAAECRRLELEALEIERRLNAKWYGGRFGLEITIGAIVAAALLATWMINYMAPLISRRQEIAALDVTILSKQSEMQRLENDRRASELESANTLVKERLSILATANANLKRQQEAAQESARRSRERVLAQEKMLRSFGDDLSLTKRERDQVAEALSASAASRVALQDQIDSLQEQKVATQVRSAATEAELQNSVRCSTYPSTEVVNVRGYGAICGGGPSTGGCTECVDPISQASCVTNGNRCLPRTSADRGSTKP